VVAWVRCETGGWPCDYALRRFDGGWIDAEPILVPDVPGEFGYGDVQVAIADDGRIGMISRLVQPDQTDVGACIVDPESPSVSPCWLLQEHIPNVVNGDVAALSDGSFAFVWPDPGQDRVHLRRYIDTETPKLPELGDESPWGNLDTPRVASIASVDGRAIVVWSAIVDGVTQIQGQVLSY
jgi:hypothetical protein